MIEFLILFIATALLGFRSIWRLFNDRFPHPSDLATLSIFYYTLPLVFVSVILKDDAGLVFLHHEAEDPTLALLSIRYAVLAAACLQLGGFFCRSTSMPVRRVFTLSAFDAIKVRFSLIILLLLLATGAVLFNVDALFAGYNVASESATATEGQALLFFVAEMIGLIIAYAYCISLSVGRTPGRYLIIISIITLIIFTLLRGKRLEVIVAFLPTIFLVFGSKPLFRRRFMRVAVISCIAVGSSMQASFRMGNTPDLASIFFNLFSEGLFAGHALTGILYRISSGQIDYEYGWRFVLGLLAVIPRFIWSNKDEIVYAINEKLEGVAPLGGNSMLGEIYLQGGGAGVAFGFILMGYLFSGMYRFGRTFDVDLINGRLPLRLLIYILTVAIFIPHFRDGLMPALKISLQAGIFLFLVVGFNVAPRIGWRAVLVGKALDVKNTINEKIGFKG